jgi:hypothetical protein
MPALNELTTSSEVRSVAKPGDDWPWKVSAVRFEDESL